MGSKRGVTAYLLFVIFATCAVLSCFAVNDCHSPFHSFVLYLVLMLVGSRPTSEFALMRCH